MCSALRINWEPSGEPLSFTNLAMYFRWGCVRWEGQGWSFDGRVKIETLKLDVARHVESWHKRSLSDDLDITTPNRRTLPSATAPWNKIRLKHHYETQRRFNGNGLVFIFSTTCIRIPLIDTTCNHNYPDSVETFSISSASESCWKLRWILCNLPNSPGVMYSWRSVWGSFLCANRAANTLATSEKFSHFSEHKDCRPRRGFSRLIKHSHICERAVNDTSSDILNDFTSFFISCISWQREESKMAETSRHQSLCWIRKILLTSNVSLHTQLNNHSILQSHHSTWSMKGKRRKNIMTRTMSHLPQRCFIAVFFSSRSAVPGRQKMRKKSILFV